jgi:peroxidase
MGAISLFGNTKLLVVISVGLVLGSSFSEGGLQTGFYSSTCPTAESVVLSTVQQSVQADPTLAAGLLRLHYHDCFVQGCDASILIAGASAEQTASGHSGLRGFDVIENAKKQLERICPGVVSCADIVALAARDAVALSNGPNYDVPTGRRDGMRSSAGDASDMPDPTDSVDVLKRKFAAKGLSASDLVVLNGAHTIGTTACFFIEDRLYNFAADGDADPSINPEYLTELRSTCPKGGDVNTRLALDRGSEFQFDKEFLENMREGNVALQSDSSMYQDGSTRGYIDSYFGLLGGLLGPSFESDFADAIVKMGQVGVKTGSNGKIRTVCSAF